MSPKTKRALERILEALDVNTRDLTPADYVEVLEELEGAVEMRLDAARRD